MVLRETLLRFGLKRVPVYGARSDPALDGPRRGCEFGARRETAPVWTQEISWIWC